MEKAILSLLFSLDVDQVTRLKHYCINEGGNYDLSLMDLNISIHSRGGRFDTKIDSINISTDAITKNTSMTIHVIDDQGIGEQMVKDNQYFQLAMRYIPRISKMNFTIKYDGFNA